MRASTRTLREMRNVSPARTGSTIRPTPHEGAMGRKKKQLLPPVNFMLEEPEYTSSGFSVAFMRFREHVPTH